MNSTKKSRKKQAKLSFSPVAPSDRRAYVTYDGSSAKKRRIDEYLQSLPTPSDGPSSSAMRQSHNSPPRSSMDLRDSRHKLSNVGGDQGKQDDDEGSSLDSSDSDMSHDSLVLKTPKAKKSNSRSKAVPESSQIFSQPPKHNTRFRRSNMLSTSRLANARHENSARSSPSSDDSSDGSDDDVLVATPHRPRQSNTSPKNTMRNAEIRDEDEDEDEDDIRPSTQRALRQSQKKTIKPDPDDVIALDDDSEDQDGDQMQAPMLQEMDDKSLLPFARPRSSVQIIKEDQDDDEENEAVDEKEEEQEEEYDDDDDDEDDIVPVSTQRRRRKAETDHDGVEQNEPVSPSSSSSRGKKLLDRDRQNEIDEDAEDLKVSTVFREDSANKKPSKHSQRLQRLRQLKDRRGNKSSSPVQIDSDPDSIEEPADDALAPLHDDDDDELDDWVVEEDEEENDIDGDGDADITDLDLMRHRKLKLKEHWDFVIKWMVSNRLNPGGMVELQPFYQLSIDRVNKECQGLIDRLVSSSWVPAFVWSLKARPDYEESPLEAIEGISMDKCGACNRSNHPPSYVVRLLGAAYNSQSLEPLKEDSDGEESFDEMGRRLPDEDRSWYLGTFCRSNAMNAHALIHWRKGLKDWVQLYLKKGGFLKSKEIAKRDSWSTSKRGRLVDEIVEELKASGITKNLWNQFSQKISSAPNVQGQQYWR